ncbi:MAG: hypothetical protein H6Q84_3637 [Deltaproteobacteria bacterium]|nr:hypothetical protein [Deltaproteobacteria bacterium]
MWNRPESPAEDIFRSTPARMSPSPTITNRASGTFEATRRATSTKSAGAFCGLKTAMVPTRGTLSSTPISFLPAARDPRKKTAVSKPLRMTRHFSGGKMRSRAPVRAFSCDTAIRESVQPAASRSRRL